MCRFFFLPFIFFIQSTTLFSFGPFPIKGDIFNSKNEKIGIAKVYPRYVEIFNSNNEFLSKVGVIAEDGLAKLFLVQKEGMKIIGHASGRKVYNSENKRIGHFVTTPTYSFIYNLKGKQQGKVKCLAWSRICAAGVASYLLKLVQ